MAQFEGRNYEQVCSLMSVVVDWDHEDCGIIDAFRPFPG